MAKSRGQSKARLNPSEARKFSIPGVQTNELLDLETLFPEIRLNLSVILLVTVFIGQIRVSLQTVKPNMVQGLESVNLLTKAVLAKSPPLTYITAAVAIRKTMAVYANDVSEEGIIEDHQDLSTNLTGSILPANKGASALLGGPEKLRAYRRGIMAQTTGAIQSAPIHSPRRIVTDIEDVNPGDFMSRLPFESSSLTYDEIKSVANKLIAPDGEPVSVFDIPTPGELKLGSSLRIYWPGIDLPMMPPPEDDFPIWKRAAINQVRKLKGE